MSEKSATAPAHEPRLVRALKDLVRSQRVASLAVVDDQGLPAVSMVPYACVPSEACWVIHVSALAAHTRCMQAHPDVGLLVCEPEVAGQPVHALQRLSVQARAELLVRESATWQACRQAYLARFAEAQPMTALGDFSFFKITPLSGRHIAGFGAARSVSQQELRQLLGSPDSAF